MPAENIILDQMEMGPLQNFLYFIGDPRSKEIAVVDPAWDVGFLRRQIDKNGYKVTAVFLTHGHPDHVNGLDEFLEHFDVPVYMSRHEAKMFVPQCRQMQMVEDRQVLKVGGVEFECLHTPGHSPGCQCFRHGNILIAGDTIFIDGCGRCDLPGSDPRKMYHSLFEVVSKLPDSIVIYPGHNYGPLPFATLAEQKQTNPYLQAENMAGFLDQRM